MWHPTLRGGPSFMAAVAYWVFAVIAACAFVYVVYLTLKEMGTI
ncbi:MAG TPA: hypothetical protein VKX17_14345 [Planctomycetota bacterium]|nr:hypothetical protein [Planctomycetota bacterium]